MSNIKNREVARRISVKTGLPAMHAEAMLRALASVILDANSWGNEVRIANLGRFWPKGMRARQYRHPKTGEIKKAAALKKMHFRAVGKSNVNLNYYTPPPQNQP